MPTYILWFMQYIGQQCGNSRFVYAMNECTDKMFKITKYTFWNMCIHQCAEHIVHICCDCIVPSLRIIWAHFKNKIQADVHVALGFLQCAIVSGQRQKCQAAECWILSPPEINFIVRNLGTFFFSFLSLTGFDLDGTSLQI